MKSSAGSLSHAAEDSKVFFYLSVDKLGFQV